MSGLSEDEDLSFLLGKELIQVCIGLHQSILRFRGATSISLECAFELSRLDQVGDEACASHTETDGLPKLLGARIVNVKNRGGGALAIAFSNNFVLAICDGNPSTEPYQIPDSARTIVV